MLSQEEKNDFKKYLFSLKEDIRERVAEDIELKGMYEKTEQEIEKALEKFDNNTYGICEMCKEDIHINRLEVYPYTPHCIACRENFEKL